ncbi:hypothetical protein JFV28_20120 [Pseudomonas sp. TH05]|uniref:hypothetical protein n=1 Tax=unclassified Pseudomonas TaxID=196821 RepID=UPI0019116B97|nr:MULTISPECIES: hypothetical protein [unclassified Pseudomonas]MBK5541569.1 hypothetical protein [Pseudomonas sp. TH07]MBK5558152.1 hypothetical protein [Pseudomonas sp. TH05]
MLREFFDGLFNRPPTQDGFAQKMIKAARDSGYSATLEYLPDEFRLRHGDNGFFNLHNAYRDYLKADKQHKPQVLSGYLATLLGAENSPILTFEQVRPLLRPVIRNRAMLEEVRLHHARSEGWDSPYIVAHRPLGKDCVTLLAVDYPETTSTLTKGPQDDWGISFDEALAIALDNLREATPDAFEEIIPGLYLGAWKDGYDTSRALLPDVLQRAPIKGQPVFMMPTRDVLMVTGDKDPEGLRHMIELSCQAVENGRVLSGQIYTYDERQIIPFVLQDPELTERLDALARLMSQGIYSMQKEMLDKVHEDQKEDVFVATYMLYENAEDNGKTFSIAAWTEGVETSLPKTDRIVLVQPHHEGSAVTEVFAWQDVESVLGELLAPDKDLYPPRYRTLGFPNAEQRSRLTPIG